MSTEKSSLHTRNLHRNPYDFDQLITVYPELKAFVALNKFGSESVFSGNVYNPFFVAAKRWGNNFHTLLYTGPVFEHNFDENSWHTNYQINSNFHYMIPGTRNFIGLEINKEIYQKDIEDLKKYYENKINIEEQKG